MNREKKEGRGRGTSRVEASLRLARRRRRTGRDAEAMEIYRGVLAHRPEDADAWREAGELADATGAYGQAVRMLGEALRLRVGDGAALEALALAHMHAGALASAARCWWRLCRADPRHTEAMAGLLVCALASGHRRMVAQMHRALAIHASRAERHRALARMWEQAAGGMVIARLTAPPVHGTAGRRSPLARLLARAAATLERAAAEHPRRADVNYHLACCRAALGKADAAATTVERALEINPRYAAAAVLKAKLDAARRAA